MVEAIHIHWRKLSMKGKQEVDAYDGSEVDMTNAINAIWKRFWSLDVTGKRALKSKMCEIAYPTTTRMCLSLEEIKIKGGVKKKQKKPIGYDIVVPLHPPRVDVVVHHPIHRKVSSFKPFLMRTTKSK